jgi:hypothetical protein
MVKQNRDVLHIATDPDPHRDQQMADEELALALLASDGVGASYPKHNSAKEKECRKALARIVRDKLNGFSGELLALAIDPETPSRYIGMTPTRQIRFESVRRGRPSTWRRDVLIAGFIRRELARSQKLEAAYAAAMAKFKISRSTAQAIWNWHCRSIKDAQARGLGANK